MRWLDKLLAPTKGETVKQYRNKETMRETYRILYEKSLFKKLSESRKIPTGTGTFTFKFN